MEKLAELVYVLLERAGVVLRCGAAGYRVRVRACTHGLSYALSTARRVAGNCACVVLVALLCDATLGVRRHLLTLIESRVRRLLRCTRECLEMLLLLLWLSEYRSIRWGIPTLLHYQWRSCHGVCW